MQEQGAKSAFVRKEIRGMAVRGISDKFIAEFLKGKLTNILNYVKSDDDLALEIRDGYVNIYYKGGNLLKIIKSEKGTISFDFDTKYCADKDAIDEIKGYKKKKDFCDEHLNFMKKQMDSWIAKNPAERIFQHELLLNCKNEIVDIEYQVGGNKKGSFRIDMILVNDGHVVLVENKSGTGAISSRPGNGKNKEQKAGIRKHYIDFLKMTTGKNKEDLVDSINSIISNKYDLKLIDRKFNVERKAPIDFLFVLDRYNFNSELFSREVQDIRKQYGDSVRNFDTRVQFIRGINIKENNPNIIVDFNNALSIFGELPVKKAIEDEYNPVVARQ